LLLKQTLFSKLKSKKVCRCVLRKNFQICHDEYHTGKQTNEMAAEINNTNDKNI